MRLICPNCAAQYEVDASMIPTEGRDVQCSSCGHTWFQRPDEAEEMLADEQGVTEHDPAFDAPDTFPEDDTEPDPEPARPPPEAPKARPTDNAAREILREEAAREAEARRREARGGGLETQPDLGLGYPEGAQSRAAAAKARLARLRQTPEEAPEDEANAASAAAATRSTDTAAVVAATVAGSRRDLLPDIEEINSTLTATGDRTEGEAGEEEVQEQKSRRGFRLGFVSILLLIVLMVLLYLFAPQLGAAVPALAPVLAGYLDWANGMLDLIDSGLQWAVDAMGGLLGRTDGEG